MTLSILDLFSGLSGWSASFADHGWEVTTLDNNPAFSADLMMDIMDYSPNLPHSHYDVILASPPCEGFSVMNIGKNWTGPNAVPPHQPKTALALEAVRMVEHTRRIIAAIQPTFFIIENPRAKLRKLPVVADLDRKTVWYCQYGLPYAKPTDLFGRFPESFVPKECRNGAMDHIAAPRGSKVGIQGPSAKNMRRGSLNMTKAALREYYNTSNPETLAALRAKVPYELSDAIRVACERSFYDLAR